MEKHWRQTISYGERKGCSEEEPSSREERRQGRWWWEYSSDEEPQPTEEAEAPKRVKKQIHLTLPTSPAHVTMTESFMTFFINHGAYSSLTESLCQKRLEYRPDGGVRQQLPEEAWTESSHAQNLQRRRYLRQRWY